MERPYQHRAIRAMVEALASGRRAGLLTMATGTGKTRTAIALVEPLMRANWVKRVLFLADRVALVNQAGGAFKEHLPDSSPVNLVTREARARAGVPEQLPDHDGPDRSDGRRCPPVWRRPFRPGDRRRGAPQRVPEGRGDLPLFDRYLLGLTATPRDEVDRDTYHLFGLETGVPTDAYSLDEAVADGFLVPPKAHSVPMKFVRQGIKYDELSDEEKEHWESLDWGDRARREAKSRPSRWPPPTSTRSC